MNSYKLQNSQKFYWDIKTNCLPSFETASSPGFKTAMIGTCCGSMQKFPEPDGTST